MLAVALAAVAWRIRPLYPDDRVLTVFTWVMYAFLAIAALSLLATLRHYEALTVTPREVRYREGPGRPNEPRTLSTAAVQRVVVRKDTQRAGLPAAVTVAADGHELRFGARLDAASKIRVKNGLIAAIAQASGRPPGSLRPEAILPGQAAARRRVNRVVVSAMLLFFAAMAGMMFLAFEPPPEPDPAGHGTAAPEPPARQAPRQTAARDTAAEPTETRPPAAPFKRWHRHYQAGQQAYYAGDQESARREFEAALKVATALGPHDAAYASTLSQLALVEERSGHLDAAVEYAKRNVEVRYRLEPEGLINSLLDLVRLEARAGHAADAARHCNQARLAAAEHCPAGSTERSRVAGTCRTLSGSD